MNQKLQNILEIIQQSEKLDAEQKNNLFKAVKEADKELEITAFKLERTEKVKRTTEILLEETIEELEQKRKAVEAQNRELEIEASLERVRAQAMSMNKSEDLLSICEVTFNELQELGFDNLRNAVIHIPNDEQNYFMDYDFSEFTGGAVSKIDYSSHPIVDEYRHKIRSSEDAFFEVVIEKDQLEGWKDFRKKSGQIDDPRIDKTDALYYYLFSIGIGDIGISTFKSISNSQLEILKRFRNVFSLAYKRYTDITLAEAQAREAQIEAALERVRARSLAMHHSSELQVVVEAVSKQLQYLDIEINGGVFITINNEVDEDLPIWGASGAANYIQKVIIPHLDKPIFTGLRDAIKNRNYFMVEEYTHAEKIEFFQHLFNHSPWNLLPPKRKKELLLCEGGYTRSLAVSRYSSIFMINHNGKNFSEADNDILRRFGKVFEQSYTRFLDLEKAEAQAREAKIEASLEKVRTVALSLKKSDEMLDIAQVLYEQLLELGFTNIRNAIIDIHNDNNETFLDYDFSHDMGRTVTLMSYHDHPIIEEQVRQIESSSDAFFELILEGQELQDLIDVRLKNGEKEDPRLRQIEQLTYNLYSFGNGAIGISYFGLLSDEQKILLKRFRNVFAFAYKRYSDMVQAENQAREAKIEASLERVRSKAMAMHSPADLSETVNVFFKELKTLGIIPIRCGVGQIDEATRTTNLTTTTSSQQGDSFQVIGKIKQTGHPVLDGIFDHWKLQKEYHPVLEGEDIKAYYDVMNPQIGYPEYPEGVTQYGNCFFFVEGFVFAWTESKLSEEELEIFRRFTSVLSLTYRRYIDLKEAEARAFEAVRQASLDRVRAEIASMRTAEDLNHITPIIWRELKTLEVPFIRCGVFIVDEILEKVQVYLTTPDGKSLGVLNLPFDSNELTSKTVEYWRKKTIYKVHWNKEEFINWTKSMMEMGQVQNAETYQGSSTPPDSLNLHFVPFTQGMLYVGDTTPLTDEKLELVKSLSEAFSIAYSRYEDFKNLEHAKNKVEVTLTELKSAQAQLIHSEKMASLGELTAGIAHEIKNPLNFINNFSELSNELLDEMKIELNNDKKEDVIEIVESLKQNLEKINQHGKRADSIVKGMLLHSRGTSGEKVSTDINELLDQYVTLAYHGMRAQNSEFNIAIEKDYDKSLEKISIVPQEMSRVFLNIINNACYAANEKKKKVGNNFNPLLKVSTKKLLDKVEIRIKDNGNGIPVSIKEQIFNPFFSTKPTGEGTGLGLSLSYDIVTKVHGGGILVESREGEGAEFIITLPKN